MTVILPQFHHCDCEMFEWLNFGTFFKLQIYAWFFMHCRNHHSDSHANHVLIELYRQGMEWVGWTLQTGHGVGWLNSTDRAWSGLVELYRQVMEWVGWTLQTENGVGWLNSTDREWRGLVEPYRQGMEWVGWTLQTGHGVGWLNSTDRVWSGLVEL